MPNLSPGPGRIMVVDDDRTHLDMTSRVLEEAGYTVITLRKPLQSSEVLRFEKPDLLLVDVNMPSLQGDIVIKIVRKHVLSERTLLLLYSACSMAELRDLCRECGADGYITKGPPDHLLRRIEFWMARHRLQFGEGSTAAD